MKRQSSSSSSKSSNKKVKIRYKFDTKDNSIFKFKWQSPNDKKMNEINFVDEPNNGNTIKIKDNH